MAKVIKVELNIDSVNKAIDELENYKASLNQKIATFVEVLSKKGIEVGRELTSVPLDDMGTLGYLVQFDCKIEQSKDTVVGYFVGQNKSRFVSRWVVKEDGKEVIKSAEISPILFYEFGSGQFAIEGHKGTFPSETAKEHTDRGYWWYKDLDGEWYRSEGTHPTQPMYHAWEEMKKQILEVGKEVFKE